MCAASERRNDVARFNDGEAPLRTKEYGASSAISFEAPPVLTLRGARTSERDRDSGRCYHLPTSGVSPGEPHFRKRSVTAPSQT